MIWLTRPLGSNTTGVIMPISFRLLFNGYNPDKEHANGNNRDNTSGDNNILPLRLRRGNSIKIGEASIEYRDDGTVVACDRYGCARAVVEEEEFVDIEPVPSIYRLYMETTYIYVDFTDRVYVSGKNEIYWTLAPIELEIGVNGVALIRLAPSKIKLTLIGDLIEGFIARYYKAPIVHKLDDLEVVSGAAIVGFRVKGDPVFLPGIGFNAGLVTFYRDRKGRLYYPLITVNTSGRIVSSRPTDSPPLEDLEAISTRRVDKTRLFSLAQSSPPFVMSIEVIRRQPIPP